ncbi:MAG: SRPBCC family protein [Candidatus Riflebacteria bacterium]|nr:SRPBCC family protein [Candidatus Riflebacteria bacterium]
MEEPTTSPECSRPSDVPGQPIEVTRKRRFKKRFLIPIGLTLLMVFFMVRAFVMGTFATREPANPLTSAQGAVRQLLETDDGRKLVRVAALVDEPLDKVWQLVTDYERFEQIFPNLESVKATRLPDGSTRLTGVGRVLWLKNPFEAVVTHRKELDRATASWDLPGGGLKVNRGSWSLTAIGHDKTLVVYALELKVDPYPAFVVRYTLLHYLPQVVEAVSRCLARSPGSP